LAISSLYTKLSAVNRLWQVLIASHKAWLKLQRCKDRFEPLLCLDALKTCSEKPSAAAASTVQKGAAVHSNSTLTGSGARSAATHKLFWFQAILAWPYTAWSYARKQTTGDIVGRFAAKGINLVHIS
jgi:hypothetical protein